MSYKKSALFFMTGTGNSFRVVSWIKAIIGQKGTATKNFQIPGIETSDILNGADSENDLLGIVLPTHGFTAPWPVIDFTLRLPRSRGTHAFVIATRAGTKIGPILLPGLEGTAAYLIALILAIKGYSVRGVTGIDMPSNWMSLHWGLSGKSTSPIISKAEKKVAAFTCSILQGRRRFNSIVYLLFGLALLPVSLLYLILGRFGLAKLFYASNRCTGCGLCVKACQSKAIKMWRKRPYWTFKCESCMRCMGYCPEKAIEASHPLLVAFILLYPFSLAAVDYIARSLMHVPSDSPILFSVLSLSLLWLCSMISTFFLYMLFAVIVRVPALNAILSFATLTHYYRRYHEPETKLKDIMPK